MTDNEPPTTITMLDDDGFPRGVVDLATMQQDAECMMLDLAALTNDPAAQRDWMKRWKLILGVDGYGYAASIALLSMAQDLLPRMVARIEELAPEDQIRTGLHESRLKAHERRQAARDGH